jgi:hypothetical protein
VIKPTPDGKGASIPASKEFIDSWNKKYPDKPWPPPSKSGKAPTGKAPKVKGPKNSLGGGAAANCLFILGYLASVVEITVALQEYERCKKDPCNCNPDLCT